MIGLPPVLFLVDEFILFFLFVYNILVFDVHLDELDIIKPIIQHEMEHAFTMSVPLDVEIGIGKNWLEAH